MSARIRLEFDYPVDLAHYPDEITTVADALRYDLANVANNTIGYHDLLAFTLDEDITATVIDDDRPDGELAVEKPR